ncbi:hypothetical protein CHU_2835 [Sporocytophaga myxococcoides]|uniref:DUF763 domain-containing protein n=2 Tax=Sporocytophaga myxococcoides TaxID=153721 RepID=A0A098LJK6_9BACT|nr:hypothetical protein CHU_2835 [Sporocytophaga myxococcoides]
MAKLGGAIIESLVYHYGTSEVLKRLSDPFWFQAFGAVLGMDWHSSGITTSVMGALKKAVNPKSSELGIYICGGKGKYSRNTPDELLKISEKQGLNSKDLIRCSRLTAKIDNNAIQDGFQLYLHSFIVTNSGEWAVVQQGMNEHNKMARRYHWHSSSIKSFEEEPHTSIYGKNQGLILNLTDKEAAPARNGILELTKEQPRIMMNEIKKLIMPLRHELNVTDVNLKRLGSVLALAHETEVRNFEELILLKDLGPRTIQSMTLVSEIIHGTPSRFKDPARFAFAHGGKDGHPFPVLTKVYDETIETLKNAVEKARLGSTEKDQAIKKLSQISSEIEKEFIPNDNFDKIIEMERNNAHKYGGMTVFGKSKRPEDKGSNQLSLF